MNLAPALGEALDEDGTELEPAPPAGWIWHEIAGAQCRDGSPTGFYVRKGSANKLLIFLEGGGACINPGFCSFNPARVSQALSGTGQTVLGSVLGTLPDRQQPGVYTSEDHRGAPEGIFDVETDQNPFKHWHQIYIPYCTGDLHFGTQHDGEIAGLPTQHFVGHLNMRRFLARIVPTFKDKVDHVLLTGASSGSAGAALNFSMVQDAFGDIPVDLICDSGLPLDDQYMPACMQKRWRETWGFAASLPPDCTECRQPNSGGLLRVLDFILRKHPNTHIGVVSRLQDEVMRLFFSTANDYCQNYETAHPINLSLGQLLNDPNTLLPAQIYERSLLELRAQYAPSGRFASFYIGDPNPNYHQHLFRSVFYEPLNATTLARWVDGFNRGVIDQVGP